MPPIARTDSGRWAVRLLGDAIDLGAASELFGDGCQIVRNNVLPDVKEIVLQADEFRLLQNSTEVYNAAERILVALNAVLYLEDPARKPLAISSVHERSDNGNWNTTVFVESASFRVRSATIHIHAGSIGAAQPPTPQSTWAQIGLSDEIVADTLSYLRGTPDWIALYKAYEAMNKDVTALKSRKGPISGWPSQSQISAFTRDAQLHRRSTSWCAKHGITGTGAMIFDDASALVRSMIKTWIEWRA
jgi:hypothetical protein